MNEIEVKFFEAIDTENLEELSKLASSNPEIINCVNTSDGLMTSALLHSIYKKKFEVTKLLLSLGADVNKHNVLGETPLIALSRNNSLYSLRATTEEASVSGISGRIVTKDTLDALKIARSLIEKKADLNKIYLNSWALSYAIKYDNLEIADLLISSGARVDISDSEGNTILHSAFKLLNSSSTDLRHIIAQLIRYGADLYRTNNVGHSPVYYLCENETYIASYYIKEYGIDLKRYDGKGYALLHSALMSGNFKLFRNLLDMECDLNILTTHGDSILHLACKHKRLEILNSITKFIASNDKNPFKFSTLISVKGNTPFHEAVISKDPSILENLIKIYKDCYTKDARFVKDHSYNWLNFFSKYVLSKNSDGLTALDLAYMHRNVKAIVRFKQYKVDVEAINSEGDTALCSAVKMRNISLVSILLEGGTTPETPNIKGQTPLALAIAADNLEIADLLISSGATIDSRDLNDLLPFHVALMQGTSPGLLAKLKLPGIDVNSPINQAGKSLLHFAIERSDKNAYFKLIALGANLDTIDANGNTLLHSAFRLLNSSSTDLKDIIAHLIQSGADLYKANNLGHSPVYYLCENETYIASYYIKEYGIDLNRYDEQGYVLLHSALMSFNFKLFRNLLYMECDLNILTTHGDSILHLACKYKNIEFLTHLTQFSTTLYTYHFDSNSILKKNNDGYSALDLAHQYSYHTALEKFYKNGVNIDTFDSEGDNAICRAIKNEDIRLVTIFLEFGASIYTPNQYGKTPLMLAVDTDNAELVSLLISKGINPNFECPDGALLIYRALEGGKLKASEKLLENGANINKKNTSGITALYMSIANDDMATFEKLLENGADIHQTSTYNNISNIYAAAQFNRPHFIRALEKLGADVNAQTITNYTALHIACYFGNTESALELIRLGANYNAHSVFCYIPIFYALQNNHLKTASEIFAASEDKSEISNLYRLTEEANIANSSEPDLLDKLLTIGVKPHYDDPSTPKILQTLIHQHNIKSFTTLVRTGINLNYKDSRGNILLTSLIISCNFEFFELLLSNGANINMPNITGSRPVDIALKEQKHYFAAALIAYYADLNYLSPSGDSPLALMIANDYKVLFEFAIKSGANINMPNIAGSRPLDIALKEQKHDFAAALIEYGAELNYLTPSGDTPLSIMIANDHKDLFEFAIKRGANINMSNITGSRPLDIALKTTKYQYAETLLKLGVQINYENVEHETPLKIAINTRNIDIVKLLVYSGADVNYKPAVEGSQTLLEYAVNSNFNEEVTLLIRCGAIIPEVYKNDPRYQTPVTNIMDSIDPSLLSQRKYDKEGIIMLKFIEQYKDHVYLSSAIPGFEITSYPIFVILKRVEQINFKSLNEVSFDADYSEDVSYLTADDEPKRCEYLAAILENFIDIREQAKTKELAHKLCRTLHDKASFLAHIQSTDQKIIARLQKICISALETCQDIHKLLLISYIYKNVELLQNSVPETEDEIIAQSYVQLVDFGHADMLAKVIDTEIVVQKNVYRAISLYYTQQSPIIKSPDLIYSSLKPLILHAKKNFDLLTKDLKFIVTCYDLHQKDYDIVTANILSGKLKLNSKSKQHTLLTRCVTEENLDAVEFLLKNGADPSKQNESDINILMQTALTASSKFIEYFYGEFGAKRFDELMKTFDLSGKILSEIAIALQQTNKFKDEKLRYYIKSLSNLRLLNNDDKIQIIKDYVEDETFPRIIEILSIRESILVTKTTILNSIADFIKTTYESLPNNAKIIQEKFDVLMKGLSFKHHELDKVKDLINIEFIENLICFQSNLSYISPEHITDTESFGTEESKSVEMDYSAHEHPVAATGCSRYYSADTDVD